MPLEISLPEFLIKPQTLPGDPAVAGSFQEFFFQDIPSLPYLPWLNPSIAKKQRQMNHLNDLHHILSRYDSPGRKSHHYPALLIMVEDFPGDEVVRYIRRLSPE